MKHLQGSGLLLAGTAVVLLAAQPVWAKAAKVTEVRLSPTNLGLNVILETSTGDSSQIFTSNRGKSLVADITNTKLRLPEGKSFRQDNPAPGIASIVVEQMAPNSIRMIVTGTTTAPKCQMTGRNDKEITLSVRPGSGATAPNTPSATPKKSASSQVADARNPAQPERTITAQKPLVPDPNVTIDGVPTNGASPSQTSAVPFMPRAVAPPVGDIAVSNTDSSPSLVDLGSNERVPRLVLRDAPAREVLSLLARSAGLNLAYTSSAPTGGQGQADQQAATGSGDGPKISVDLENESVQDAFNYVLKISGLQANRIGQTIFVAPKLPNEARDVTVRSLRLNQVTVGVALNFLVAMGAESAVSRERTITNVNAVPVGGAAQPVTQTSTSTETRIETQRIDFQDSVPLLRGLQVIGDERTNSLTLVGSPKQIDVATSQIVQLDSRRRQVAVNVKIIDVNLLATEDFNTSFSFGVGNSFFVNDKGAAVMNFGGGNPPTSLDTAQSLTTPTVIKNPYAGAESFLDPNNTILVPGIGIGSRLIENGNLRVDVPGGAAAFLAPSSGVPTNPYQAGITDYTIGTPNVTTVTDIPATAGTPATAPVFNPITGALITPGTAATPGTPATREINTTLGTPGTITTALPSLFQYPKRFLSTLQAQIVSGNAKVLTDPTLIVQEGQTANVNLTQEVVGNIERTITDTAGGSRETISVKKEQVGLTLGVKIERIDDNGFVSLSVAPVVKAPQAPAQTPNGQVFLVSERSLNSGLIRLKDNQTLILSGIIQDSDRSTVSKIPILGDLPIIGSLFRSTNRQNQRQEVIVLLTPQMMDDSERSSSLGYNYKPSPEARQMLERRGLQVPNSNP